jgi:hypothetical protein
MDGHEEMTTNTTLGLMLAPLLSTTPLHRLASAGTLKTQRYGDVTARSGWLCHAVMGVCWAMGGRLQQPVPVIFAEAGQAQAGGIRRFLVLVLFTWRLPRRAQQFCVPAMAIQWDPGPSPMAGSKSVDLGVVETGPGIGQGTHRWKTTTTSDSSAGALLRGSSCNEV